MLARFFASRPVFAWVISIVIMLAGVASILRAAGRAVPRRRAAERQHLGRLPRRVGRDRREQRHPGARAAAHRHRRPAVLLELVELVGSGRASTSRSSRAPTPTPRRSRSRTRSSRRSRACRRRCSSRASSSPSRRSNFLMIVAIYDATDKATEGDISDYLASTMQDPIARVDGVGASRCSARSYAMRIWLDPAKLLRVQPDAVRRRGRDRGAERPGLGRQDRPAAGAAGPAAQRDGDRAVQAAHRRSSSATSSSSTTRPARRVRLGDVARVELGSETLRRRGPAQRPPGVGHRRACSRRTRTRSTVADDVKAVVDRARSARCRRAGRSSYPFDTHEVHPASRSRRSSRR